MASMRSAGLGLELFTSGRMTAINQQLTSLSGLGAGSLVGRVESLIRSAGAALPGWSRLAELQPPPLADAQLLAVPKRKVTPHRKGKRSATKGIRFIPIVSQCSKCERVFPPHAMPSKCDDDACPAFNLRERPASTFSRRERAADSEE